MSARYRKFNDGSHNSSTYHKKDGTPVRTILKREADQEVETELRGGEFQKSRKKP